MKLALGLITSVLTLLTMYLAGNGDRLAWKVGLANNVFWWWFTILTGSWGLIPLNAALIIVYFRNLYKKPVLNKDRETLHKLLVDSDMDADYFIVKLEERLK